MASSGAYFAILCWICLMYAIGLWIFSSGFLLKRIVINNNSSCNDILEFRKNGFMGSEETISKIGMTPFLTEKISEDISTCWLPQKFTKAVIIIIDALRYDFTLYDNKLNKRDSVPPYRNKLPIIKELLNSEHGLLLKFVADPPTTTLQRLKGLTTGSLPTFIDVSSNFASYEITEDSLIRQFFQHGKKIVFMGDDTWEGLFPGHFHRMYPYPSFNVKDLDTVDNGIMKHLIPELQNKDWDILIAHFLGVDHCGHRYGPLHPAMAAKLGQMNEVIRSVANELDQDSVLFVFGDHGMTRTGDHGGDSEDELNSALFVYSPGLLVSKKFLQYPQSSAAQVDLVPTLSLLLGVPIPFSSLGSVIAPLFYSQSRLSYFSEHKTNTSRCLDSSLQFLMSVTTALALNAAQVHRYLIAYTSVSSELSPEILSHSEEMLNKLSSTWTSLGSACGNISKMHHTINHLYKGYKEFLLFVRQECEQMWATFDHWAMILGLFLIAMTTITTIVFAIHIVNVPLIFIMQGLIKGASFGVVIALAVHAVSMSLVGSLIQDALLVLSVVSMLDMMRYQFSKLWCTAKISMIDKSTTFSGIVIFAYFIIFFSNSFVITEDRISLFLLQSSILVLILPLCIPNINILVQFHQKSNRRLKKELLSSSVTQFAMLICLMLFVRLGSAFYKCREEQSPCETSMFLSSLASISPELQGYRALRLLLSWSAIISPLALLVYWLHACNSVKVYSPPILCLHYAFPTICLCVCLHWALSLASPYTVERVLQNRQTILCQAALVLSCAVLLILFLFPLMVEEPWTLLISQIYTSSHCQLAVAVLYVIFTVIGDGLASAVAFMGYSTSLFLAIISKANNHSVNISMGQKLEPSKTIGESVPWLAVLIWGLLSCYWFYATGHQPTFSAIHWNAAFTVVQGEVTHYFLPALLVILNTFSSNLFFGVSLPLLYTCYVQKRHTGEFQGSLLQLMLRYLAFSGVKVLGAVAACLILRRHLMVWKIFAPRLIFEAVSMAVTVIGVAIGYLFLLRTHFCFQGLVRADIDHVWSNR